MTFSSVLPRFLTFLSVLGITKGTPIGVPFVMAGAGDTTKSCAKQSFARGVGCGFAPRAQNGGVQPPSKHAPRVACDLRLGSESNWEHLGEIDDIQGFALIYF